MFLLLCDGAAGVSWSITTAASLTSEGAESDGGAEEEESAGTDSVPDTITVFSEGDGTSMAEYESQGGKGRGGKD